LQVPQHLVEKADRC